MRKTSAEYQREDMVGALETIKVLATHPSVVSDETSAEELQKTLRNIAGRAIAALEVASGKQLSALEQVCGGGPALFAIRCAVKGGVTGSRDALLKTNGEVVYFGTREAAEEEAARLRLRAAKNAATTDHPAVFSYTVEEA